MRIGSLFSGIGGLELGLETALRDAGHDPEVVWQVELNEYCRNVLAKHWPNARRFSDVTSMRPYPLTTVDLICGGFPCQDIAGCGKGAGLAGSRSGLWFEFERIVAALRPEWVVVENVASGAKRWVDAVSSALEQLGYETLPVPLSGADVGAPHIRRRVFIVAHAVGEQLRQQPGRRRGSGRPGAAGAGVDGEAGAPADANRRRRKGGRVAAGGRVEGEAGGLSDRRRRAWQDDQRETWAAWRQGEGSPVPGVCGVDDGPSTKVDRARLTALGNAVVPQCAEVIGWIVAEVMACS